MTASDWYARGSDRYIGSGYFGNAVSTCGIYTPPHNYYGYQPIEVTWTQTIEKLTTHVKEPKRNPNGYRQRKLKARLNQVK